MEGDETTNEEELAPTWRGPYIGRIRSANFESDWNADGRKAMFMIAQGETNMQFYMATSPDTGKKFFIFFHPHTKSNGMEVNRYATVVAGKHGIPHALAYTTGPDPRAVNINEAISDQRVFSVSSDGYHLDLDFDDDIILNQVRFRTADDSAPMDSDEEDTLDDAELDFRNAAARRSTKADRELVKQSSFYVIPSFNTNLFLTVSYFRNVYGERRIQLTDDVRLAVKWKIANFSSSESMGPGRKKKGKRKRESCCIQ